MRTILLGALALLAFNVALVALGFVWAFIATRDEERDWTCTNSECGAVNSWKRQQCRGCWTPRSGELPYLVRML